MAPLEGPDLNRGETLQAVILGESFNSKFKPLTDGVPFALLPLQGRPLIDYGLDLLFSNSFQEVFIFCHSSSADQIKTYLGKSRWAKFGAQFALKVISADCYMSLGDMMRDLDGKAYIRNDFLLLQSGVISNMDLGALIRAHRNNRKISEGKNLMTVAVRQLCPSHHTRSPDEHFAVMLDSNSKILYAHFTERRLKYLDLPLNVLTSTGSVVVRADLAQTKIAFCSSHVPVIFSDNFDYQHIDDFVKGIIEHEEIMGNSIYLHEIRDAYCACVTNPTMYSQVSLDIAKRWTYPHTVEMYVRDCVQQRGGVYLGSASRVAATACVGRFSVVLGQVGEESQLSRCFVGLDSKIGARVHVTDATIGKNVIIENDCQLSHCLIGDNCIVYQGSKLTRGCILGNDVRVGPSAQLTHRKLQSVVPKRDNFADDDDEPVAANCMPFLEGKHDSKEIEFFGHKAVAFDYVDNDATDNESDSDNTVKDEPIEERWGVLFDEGSVFSEGFLSQDDDDAATESGKEDELDGGCDVNVAPYFDEADGGCEIGRGTEDADMFFKEVLESLQRGLEENIKPENLILEINSSKHAYNITITEVVQLTVNALLQLCVGDQAEKTYESFMTTFKKSSAQFLAILRNYLKRQDSQRICLKEIGCFYERLNNSASSRNTDLIKTMQNIVNYLYQKDILTEAIILSWFDNLKNETLKLHIRPFIEWLTQDSSDDATDEEHTETDEDGDDEKEESEDEID